MNKRLWVVAIGVVMAQLLGMASAMGAVYTGSVRGYLEEWLPVTLAVDTQYAISMTGTSGVAGYAGFYLYDSTKSHTIDSSYAYSTASTRSPNALKAGSYWIKVWGNNSSADGTYTISTSETAAPLANDGSSNASKSAALAATLETANTGHIGYLDGNTHNWEDWWQVTLPSDGLLSLDFVISGKSDLFLASSGYYLFSANDKTMDSTTSLGSSRSPASLKAGTYYIKLWVNSAYQYASYSLTPRLSAAPLANDSEQNDSKAAARDATLNAANTGHIGYDADNHDWEDWWKITLPSDGLLSLDFVISGKSDLFLASSGYYLFSANDKTMDSTTSLGSTRSPVSLKAGTYYMKLWINSTWQYASYSFTPTLSAAPLANDSEQNDSKATAQDATLNGANTGHIGYDADSHDWEDWWKITLPSDDTLTLNFETSGVSNSFASSAGYYLFDSNDSTKYSAYFSSSTAGSVALKAGTYYLKVWINSYYQYASYAFTPSLTTGQTATTTTTSTTTTSTTTTTVPTGTTTTNMMSLGAWTVYGTSSLQGGTLTIGDYIGYDTADSDSDGNPYNTWFTGSASGQSGGDYDEAVSVQEFSMPLTLSWTGCFPDTSYGYNNIFLGRKNTLFTGLANSQQYPIAQEFGLTARWDMTGLNTTVLSSGSYDIQQVTSATATSNGYCGDYRIEWADNLLKFYYNGAKVREQAYTYAGPVSVIVRSFEKPHTFTAMSMVAGASTTIPSLPDTQAPSIPTGLVAAACCATQINLSWTASTDAVGVTAYKVYRGGVLVATLGNVTTHSDTGLSPSTTYTYSVAACDAAGNCSTPSSAASGTTAAATTTNSRSDCLFEWAESNYSFLFSPKAQSISFGPYYLRYYSQTNAYLAVVSSSLVYLGPLTDNQLADLGDVSAWYANAGCN